MSTNKTNGLLNAICSRVEEIRKMIDTPAEEVAPAEEAVPKEEVALTEEAAPTEENCNMSSPVECYQKGGTQVHK